MLPFVDRSDKRDQEYFADGITEELIIYALTRLWSAVASSTSGFARKGGSEDIRSIGRQLGVTQVIEGNLRRSGDQLRITATLVTVADGIRIWTQQYNRAAGDAFLIQQQIAQEVARALQLKLVVGSGDASVARPNANACKSYLRGRYALGDTHRNEHADRPAVLRTGRLEGLELRPSLFRHG